MSYSRPDENEAFALIIDTSSSKAVELEEAWQMAENIYSLSATGEFKVFMLGNPVPLPSAALKQSRPPEVNRQARPCSLIAPIMESLVREERRHSVIIVGSGRIFDLDDWIDDPRVDGWLLVLIGAQSPLQGADGRIREFRAEQIAGMDTDALLDSFTRLPPPALQEAKRADDPGPYEWQVDATGYPLIFVKPLEAYVHLFPVTKPQFERFVATGKGHGMDDKWYEERDASNPRASYCNPDVPALERLLMTGVSTDEALAFNRWLGREYKLLSAKDWNDCYEWFEKKPAPAVPRGLAERMSRDALAIWDIVEAQILDQRGLVDLWQLSLMRQGILEWVVELPGRYHALGDPATDKSLRKYSDPMRLLGAEPRRHKNLGFRLRTR